MGVINPGMPAAYTVTVFVARGHLMAQFAVLGAVLLAFEILVDGTVGPVSGRLGSWLSRRRGAVRRLNVATGSIYLGLATKIAVSR